MKACILLVIAVSAITAIPQPKKIELWQDYKVQFGKQYDKFADDHQRMKIFLDNLKEIEEHNAKYDAGLVTYKKGINQFTDVTKEEFRKQIGCVSLSATISNRKMFVPPPNVTVPPSFDWRTQGAVTEVKHQQDCGACWAFSVTGALEGQLFQKTGKLVSLSEQNLVDCSTNTSGCNGGFPAFAFDYIRDNNGIDTEEFYPYEHVHGTCRYNPKYSAGTDTGSISVTNGDEEVLKTAVATVGPISVIINAENFNAYESGVVDNPNCKTELEDFDHAVLLVGYGTTENGQDYWLVKNSWGPHWGEGGYIRMSRNKNNQCGIASYPYYPTV